MSNIEIINELEKTGALKSLIKAGLFPSKIYTHIEIYLYVKSKTHVGVGKTTAVTWASDLYGTSSRQIYKIIKSFEAKL